MLHAVFLSIAISLCWKLTEVRIKFVLLKNSIGFESTPQLEMALVRNFIPT